MVSSTLLIITLTSSLTNPNLTNPNLIPQEKYMDGQTKYFLGEVHKAAMTATKGTIAMIFGKVMAPISSMI